MIVALRRFRAGAGFGATALGRSFAAFLCACSLVTALCLTPLVVGFVMFGPLERWLDALADDARQTAPNQELVLVGAPDGHLPTGLLDRVRHTVDMVVSAGFWRRLVWAAVDIVVVAATVLLPMAIVAYGVFGVVVQPFVWSVIERAGGNNWYAFVHVDSWASALWAIPVGLAFVALGVVATEPCENGYGRWVRAMLSTTLTERNRALAASRAGVVDDRDAGLARIQRDLHDGAQARLVAMGMSLDQALRVLDADPGRARLLLTEAQQLSASALAELRDLVHGIGSPVLADRGLGDAVRSLVLDTGLDVDVTVDLPSRPTPPVEAAVFYALSELITNAAKHAHAGTVSVAIAHDRHRLTARVNDDGIGGADLTGAGLSGISRRLAVFDGTLRLVSPPGGPTEATIVLPCTLS